MTYHALLRKMTTELHSPIRYFLDCENDVLLLHDCLNRNISIKWEGTQCLHCQQEKPIFRQGFCQSCFFEIPQAGDWIMRPELSKAHLDIEDRDLTYEKKVQLQPHVVYLAVSSHLKVGITRKSQVPTRWIDQGAHQAITLLEVPNRYLSGVAEVAMKVIFSDKTNWRKMLQNNLSERSLSDVKTELTNYLDDDLKQYITLDSEINKVNFPVIKYPTKVKSVTLDKVPQIEEKLVGIKGQYLLFDNDTVFNVRRHAGYLIQLSF